MKNLIFTFGLFLMGGLAMASNEIISENSSNYIKSIVIEEQMEDALTEKCYARKCVTYEGSDGYEYKRCGPWEETACPNIELAS